jgi:hypothetical protein
MIVPVTTSRCENSTSSTNYKAKTKTEQTKILKHVSKITLQYELNFTLYTYKNNGKIMSKWPAHILRMDSKGNRKEF